MSKKGKRVIPKFQKQISQELTGPAFDKERGNPNDAVPNKVNRGNQLSYKGDTVKPFSIGIQDIDESIMYYYQNVIKPEVFQNGTMIPIPIIYGSPERWKSVQKDGYYRDKAGRIMAPIIMFKRNTVEKVRNISRKLDANHPNNYDVYGKKYSKKNEYDNFNVLNKRKPQETFYAVVMPEYITLDYSCMIYTYYVEQMNKIVESINYASDSYWGDPERFKFRARIDSYATNVTLQQGSERLVKTDFNIKMNGYIIPDTINSEVNSLKKWNSKTLKINFEIEKVNTSIDKRERDC